MEFQYLLFVALGALIASASADESTSDYSNYNNESSFSESANFAPGQECAHRFNQKGFCLLLGEKNYLSKLVVDEEEEADGFFLVKKSGQYQFSIDRSDPIQIFGYISFIQVTNLMEPSHRGYVTLTEGGVGYQNVTLAFESQRGHGYHFSINIYVNPEM